MKIIYFDTVEQAIIFSLSEIQEYRSLKSNVCLTGGRFGIDFCSNLIDSELDISDWRIFQTDERLDTDKEETIQLQIIESLKVCKGYRDSNMIFFPQSKIELESGHENLSQLRNEENFDLVFLSLGEDGHLAGHFKTSEIFEDGIFCRTDNAPKNPKERISYTINYLYKSKKIILVCFGQSKEIALKDFISGKGMHSFLKDHRNITLLTNLQGVE